MLTIWPTPLTSLVALVPGIAAPFPRANRPNATNDMAKGCKYLALSGCVSA